jgi:hypothetical protein
VTPYVAIPQYGALTAIFSNIENETYIKEILPNMKDFIREKESIEHR